MELGGWCRWGLWVEGHGHLVPGYALGVLFVEDDLEKGGYG